MNSFSIILFTPPILSHLLLFFLTQIFWDKETVHHVNRDRLGHHFEKDFLAYKTQKFGFPRLAFSPYAFFEIPEALPTGPSHMSG